MIVLEKVSAVKVGEDVFMAFEKGVSGGWFEVLGVREPEFGEKIELWLCGKGFDDSELVRLEEDDDVVVQRPE